MRDVPEKPDPRHTERAPKSGFIGQAAQNVARYCKLPDPRPQGTLEEVGRFFRGLIRGRNHMSEEACETYIIGQKAESYGVAVPAKGSRDYDHILRHAEEFAKLGAKLCQVRDFLDPKDEPLKYEGYRAQNGQCAVRKVPYER